MDFREKIRQILALSGLKKKFIDKITDKDGMELYRQAFTHESVEPELNYQWLEVLGDQTLNKGIVWYINNRFPQLHNKEGVKVISRLKINLVSKKHFSEIARKLGFLPFIRYNPQNNNGKPILEIDLLEDVLESFFGATELLIDKVVSTGAGYGICYHLIQSIMDPVPISLRYEDLYDAVTRLKELFDTRKELQPVGYTFERVPTGGKITRVFSNFNKPNQRLLGEAFAPTEGEGKELAASLALKHLAQRGIFKPVNPYYLNPKYLGIHK